MRKLSELDPATRSNLEALARNNPNQWAYEIDYPYPATQPTPPEAIRGAWQVDAGGQLIDFFRENPRYRALEETNRKLKDYMHAGARHNRDQWITEVDERGEKSFPSVPANLIRGWWYVDKDGMITALFRPNSLYEPHAAPLA